MTKAYYRFSYEESAPEEEDDSPYGANKNMSYNFSIEAGDRWHFVLYNFVKFLEGCGYSGVQERIRTEGSPYWKEHDWLEPFKTYSDDKDKEELKEAVENALNAQIDADNAIKDQYEDTAS